MQEEGAQIAVVPATADLFDDMLRILPTGLGCTCQYFRMSSGDYSRSTPEERVAALRRQAEGSPAPGLLAYEDGEPIGWCGFGPRHSLGRLMRSRTIPLVDDLPVWSIVCFVVKTGHRRKSATHRLLAGTIDYARAHGAPALEAYPIDPGERRVNTTDLYVGRVSTFESFGFRRVMPTTATAARLPRVLMRLDLR